MSDLNRSLSKTQALRRPWLLASAVAIACGITACGGGGSDAVAPQANMAELASGTTTLALGQTDANLVVPDQTVLPTYHLAPVILNEPSDVDAVDANASARMAPRKQAIPSAFRSLSSSRLTVQALQAASQQAGNVTPDASTGVVSTYTPAQIRAAYGFTALPTGTLTAAQAAQLGAGQTIYLVDAMADTNVVAELAAFNSKFGLPTCSTTTLSATTSLPLAAASTSGCSLTIAYSTYSGGLTNTAPAYNSGWAGEIALDVQWAHATAPLARLVLIEAPDATSSGLMGAVQLANRMGPGAVSMSWGSTEGSWDLADDSLFTTANMSYFAATGDNGTGVIWPSVSSHVVAVGGTSLTYSGSGARTETTWSGTGGGVSAYTPTPSYQSSAVPGVGTLAHRAVADVAFNADPSTGQYLAIITPGSSTVNWMSAGGTSMSTPQWAGLIAVANAQRAAASQAVLGDPHTALYTQIATVPGTYAADLKDITSGADGSCSACGAKTGYDEPTGLGTPNVSNLLSTLTGATVAPTAPVVTSASISGTVGTALSFTVSVTAPNAVTYTMTGAPSGMSISTAGVVSWATPVAGSYSVTVTAKDSKTGLSGSGVYTVTVTNPAAPVGVTQSVSGKVGTALSFTASFTSVDTLTYTISGAPTGMTLNATTGVVSWPSPVLGTYTVTITATDSKTKLTGKSVYTVTIAAASTTTTASGPTITASPITGVAGKPVSGTITVADPGVSGMGLSISGAPLGMTFAVSGYTVTASWANPVTGNYSLAVVLTDSNGKTAKASVPITITAH